MEVVLCSEIYHCTPSELDRQDAWRVMGHLRAWNAWQEHLASGAGKRQSMSDPDVRAQVRQLAEPKRK